MVKLPCLEILSFPSWGYVTASEGLSKGRLPSVFPIPLDFLTLVGGHIVFFGTQSVTDQNMHAVNDIAMSMKSFARVLQVLPGSSVMQETQLSSMKTNFMQQALQMRGKLKRRSSWSWLSAELHRVQRMNNDEQ